MGFGPARYQLRDQYWPQVRFCRLSTMRGSPNPAAFLFTAACLTGFGDAVGSELLGSLVDYDRADLLGAVLTSWPIHGKAATVFTSYFYEELKNCRDASRAIKIASQRTRDLLPHPYFWAPFNLLGSWSVGELIRWQ